MSHAATRPQADMRGFHYELEPLRARQQWRLEALQARLGDAQRAVDKARAQAESLQALHEREVALAARAVQSHLDAAAYRRTLAYLAQLHAQVHGQRQALHRLRHEHRAAQRACQAAQQKLEALAAHRDMAVQDYVEATLRRQANEADRDWLARAHWRTAQQPAPACGGTQ